MMTYVLCDYLGWNQQRVHLCGELLLPLQLTTEIHECNRCCEARFDAPPISSYKVNLYTFNSNNGSTITSTTSTTTTTTTTETLVLLPFYYYYLHHYYYHHYYHYYYQYVNYNKKTSAITTNIKLNEEIY